MASGSNVFVPCCFGHIHCLMLTFCVMGWMGVEQFKLAHMAYRKIIEDAPLEWDKTREPVSGNDLLPDGKQMTPDDEATQKMFAYICMSLTCMTWVGLLMAAMGHIQRGGVGVIA